MPHRSRIFAPLIRPLLKLLIKARIVDHNLNQPVTGQPVYLLEKNRWSHRQLVSSFMDNQHAPGEILTLDSDRGDQFHTQIEERLKAQASNPLLNYQLVPVGIYHGRMPKKEHNWLKLSFAEGWAKRSLFGRAMQILFNGRLTLIRISPPLALQEIINENQSSKDSTRKIVRTIRHHFATSRRMMIGPDLSHSRTILSLVMKDPQLQQVITKQAQATGSSKRSLEIQCQQNLKRIAANFNPTTARILHSLLSWVWKKLYRNIRVLNADKLQQQSRDHQLLYLPCHRSHLDYLLLSYMLYEHGLMLPHIAAGENLNIPVVGPLLRRGGAMFMRRKFHGDQLYYASFRAYLNVMTQRGHSLEYFIEGGRSRTGRLLPPKTGLLQMTVENHLHNPTQAVALAPVWISYDRLVESSSYQQELAGAHKKKESIGDLLSTLRILKQQYGEASLCFGDPIPLHFDQALDPQDRSQLKPHVEALAHQVMRGINQACIVNSTALLATVLLAKPNTIHTRNGVEKQLASLNSLLIQLPNAPQGMPEMAIEQWLDHAVQIGILDKDKDGLIELSERQFGELVLYRNNIQHLLALPGLILLLAQRLNTSFTLSITRILCLLYPLLQAELFLPWSADQLAGVIRRIIRQLNINGLLEKEGLQWRPCNNELTLTLIQTTEPILLRYYICLSVLNRYGNIERNDLLEASLSLATRAHRLFGFDSREYADIKVFETFIDLQCSQGLLIEQEGIISSKTDLAPLFRQSSKILRPQLVDFIQQQLARS